MRAAINEQKHNRLMLGELFSNGRQTFAFGSSQLRLRNDIIGGGGGLLTGVGVEGKTMGEGRDVGMA